MTSESSSPEYHPELAHYISVTAIIVKAGKYLITKRVPKEKHFADQWTVPGGKLEMSDYSRRSHDAGIVWYNVINDSLRREVMEEVGLTIKNIRYLTDMTFLRKDGIPTVIISMFADYESGAVQLCDELDDHAWVTLEEARQYNLIPGIYEELEMLDHHLKTGQMKEWKKNQR
jgi:8-oxo-dGTP pyrophosphatase MutT (NUDIX family)